MCTLDRRGVGRSSGSRPAQRAGRDCVRVEESDEHCRRRALSARWLGAGHSGSGDRAARAHYRGTFYLEPACGEAVSTTTIYSPSAKLKLRCLVWLVWGVVSGNRQGAQVRGATPGGQLHAAPILKMCHVLSTAGHTAPRSAHSPALSSSRLAQGCSAVARYMSGHIVCVGVDLFSTIVRYNSIARAAVV